MPARRVALPPPVTYLPKASLDSTALPGINSVLKQLKSCTRRLQAALASHALELRVLERLYYKGKNQHRTALFWRNVSEIRRYGERVEIMDLYGLVERMRIAFWGETGLQNARLLKGSWTHCPDIKHVMFVMQRCLQARLLLEKALDRLSAAYHSFTLMMQTAAFLQFILTLTAITSRLSNLLTEVQSCVGLAEDTCRQLSHTLDVGNSKGRKVDDTHAGQQPKLAQSSRRLADERRPAEDVAVVSEHVPIQAGTENMDEDVGAVLVRQLTSEIETKLATPPPMVTPPEVVPSLDLNSMPTTGVVTASQSGADRPGSIIQTSVKRKVENETQLKKVKKKVKKKRDEIDDIFGI